MSCSQSPNPTPWLIICDMDSSGMANGSGHFVTVISIALVICVIIICLLALYIHKSNKNFEKKIQAVEEKATA